MDLELLLLGLRGMAVPEPVSVWPLAPIWWVCLLLLMASMLVGLLKKRPQKNPYLALGLSELNTIRKAWRQHQSNAMACAQLSSLLRRLALAHYPRARVAALIGPAWLAFLDNSGRTQAFSQGIGRALICAPYEAAPEVNLAPLFKLTRGWIKAIGTPQ